MQMNGMFDSIELKEILKVSMSLVGSLRLWKEQKLVNKFFNLFLFSSIDIGPQTC
jgi:hypothetical protein